MTPRSPWFAAQQVSQAAYEGAYNPTYVEGLEPTPVRIPTGPGRTRPLGNVGTIGAVPHPRDPEPQADQFQAVQPQPDEYAAERHDAEWAEAEIEFGETAYKAFVAYTKEHQDYPSVEVLDIHLSDGHNVSHPRSAALLRRLLPGFKQRFDSEMAADHIA